LATLTRTILEDDLDGGEADETIIFALDGVTYEIDLNSDHAEALRDAFGKYVEAARRTGGRQRQAGTVHRITLPRQKAPIAVAERHAIQRFALREGLRPPAERGRIAQSVVEAWEAAGKPQR
jgi:hypothetical protein